jgi:hypothetical protein
MREHRPRDLSPTEIGFTRQPPVPWLNPSVLVRTGAQVAMAYLFGSFLDKRELQGVFPDPVHDHTADDELWLDFTADVGDGFDSTYSIAYLMAARELDVAGAPAPLPRNRVLVLGGDQVYPSASARTYEDRWKGPYRAALPELGPASPTIYAIPGNHDWYDGLTAFLRLFAQNDPVGGWFTAQERSYFALRLPQNWSMFAIDIQLDSYIDEPQLTYFRKAAAELGPDDRVIVTVARPAWVMSDEFPEAYDSIDYFIRTIIEPTSARIPLILAGDYHHYSRYEGPGPDGRGRQLVTCGGGAAYLTDTAQLPDEAEVPAEDTRVRAASEPRQYRKAASYPSAKTSRLLGWQVFARLPLRNRGFVGLLGFLQTMLMLALLGVDGWGLNPAVGFATGAVLVGTIVFAVLMGRWGSLRHWIAGILHAVPHFALGVAGTAVWLQLPFVDTPQPWALLLAFVLYLPVIGVIDAWVLSAYLLVARQFGVNINELFAGLGIDDYKSFLRLHIAADGALTIYPIAVDKVGRKWQAHPHAPKDAPWIVPTKPLEPRLIEAPIVISTDG